MGDEVINGPKASVNSTPYTALAIRTGYSLKHLWIDINRISKSALNYKTLISIGNVGLTRAQASLRIETMENSLPQNLFCLANKTLVTAAQL